MVSTVQFEIASIVLYTALLGVVVFYVKKKEYVSIFIASALIFPTEYVFMKMVLFYEFSPDFNMVVTGFPWMLIFLHGCYWGSALSICFYKRNAINKLGKYKKGIFLYIIFVFQDIAIEYVGTTSRLWTYPWPAPWMVGGLFPVVTPFIVSTYSVGLYYVNEYIYARGKDKGWLANVFGRVVGYGSVNLFLNLLWAAVIDVIGPF